MIRDPRGRPAAFSEATDGDMRGDGSARDAMSRGLGVASEWASVTQVHGSRVVYADQPGNMGEADAVWTDKPGLPLAIFTADCLGLVVGGRDAVGVGHAGWRGVAAAVGSNLVRVMTEAGHDPAWGAVGPGIASCCFEVGDEVVTAMATPPATTSWGTVSVDLVQELASQLGDLDLWFVGACTHHEERWFSHRRNATPARLVTLGWVP